MGKYPKTSITAKSQSRVKGITTNAGNTDVDANRSTVEDVVTGERGESLGIGIARAGIGLLLVIAGLVLIFARFDGEAITIKLPGGFELAGGKPGLALCLLGTALLGWPLLQRRR